MRKLYDNPFLVLNIVAAEWWYPWQCKSRIHISSALSICQSRWSSQNLSIRCLSHTRFLLYHCFYDIVLLLLNAKLQLELCNIRIHYLGKQKLYNCTSWNWCEISNKDIWFNSMIEGAKNWGGGTCLGNSLECDARYASPISHPCS